MVPIDVEPTQTGVVRVFQRFGIDRSVTYTVVGRGCAIVTGLGTLALISRLLTPTEQGVYYTFASVLALQIFFELGLSFVLLQCASHERSELQWKDGILAGNPTSKARLHSLLRFAIGWYGIAAALMVLIVLPAGVAFFSRSKDLPLHWRISWSFLVLGTALNLAISPIFAILEGCGLVAEVALMRIGQSVGGNLLFWIALWRGWGLISVPIVAIASFVYGLSWLLILRGPFLQQWFNEKRASAKSSFNWRTEIWPFQWRIALSWLSGYFIFQLFTPVLFAFHGPVVAGQMGMSIQITSALFSVAMAWLTTKAPIFGVLIARKQYVDLDRTFFASFVQSFSVILMGGVVVWFAVLCLNLTNNPLSNRVLGPIPFGLLLATSAINHIVNSEAIYLRAHKQEPFLRPSVLNGILIGSSTYFLGRFYDVDSMVFAYFLISLVSGLGLGTWIFLDKRRCWHGPPALAQGLPVLGRNRKT